MEQAERERRSENEETGRRFWAHPRSVNDLEVHQVYQPIDIVGSIRVCEWLYANNK
jgi:hypothetical protein